MDTDDEDTKPWAVFFEDADTMIEMSSEYLLYVCSDFTSWANFLCMAMTGTPAQMTCTKHNGSTVRMIVVRKDKTSPRSTFQNPYAGLN